MRSYWMALLAASLFEVIWVAGFKAASLDRPMLALWTFATLLLSMLCLWVATRGIPLGVAYAVWTGIGAVGAIVVGAVVYGETLGAVRLSCVALIVAGVVGLKLTSE